MDERLKERLVGATVLVFLAVIFVPMVLDSPPRDEDAYTPGEIPAKPAGGFSSRVVPLEPAPDEPDSPEESLADAARSGPGGEAVSDSRSVADAPGPASPDRAPVVPRAPDAGMQETSRSPRRPSRAGSSEEAGLTAWAIQLGSFSNQDNAATLKERLLKMGYDAFMEPVATEKGTVTRVFIGPMLEREQAQAQMREEKLEQLRKEMKLDALLRRYPGG